MPTQTLPAAIYDSGSICRKHHDHHTAREARQPPLQHAIRGTKWRLSESRPSTPSSSTRHALARDAAALAAISPRTDST